MTITDDDLYIIYNMIDPFFKHQVEEMFNIFNIINSAPLYEEYNINNNFILNIKQHVILDTVRMYKMFKCNIEDKTEYLFNILDTTELVAKKLMLYFSITKEQFNCISLRIKEYKEVILIIFEQLDRLKSENY